MILINPYSVQAAGGGSYDTDAQAFFTAAGISDSTQKSAVNTLVVALKGYSIWTKMLALYPFVGGTATTHKYNLKDPQDLDASYRITWNGSFTHNANGITGDGSTGWGNTHFNGSALSLQNSSHLSVYSRTNSAAGDMNEIAAYNGNLDAWRLMVRDDGNIIHACMYAVQNAFGAVDIQVANSNSQGHYIATARSSTDAAVFKNGSSVGTSSSSNASHSIPTSPVALCALLGSGGGTSGPGSFSNRNLAFASIGSGLTDAEAANFYTAVQAYQTTLTRNV